MTKRSIDALIGDLLLAGDAAVRIVERGKRAWNGDLILRLAGEAVVGRIGDAAAKLPPQVRDAIPEVPWSDAIGLRIVVDNVYHRVDYESMWTTLKRDVPVLVDAVRRWAAAEGAAG